MIVGVTFAVFLALWGTVIVGQRVLVGADILYRYQPWAGEPGAREPRNTYVGDPVTQFVEWTGLVKDSYGRGEMPLWNPYTLGGTPLLANDQSAPFSPFTLAVAAVQAGPGGEPGHAPQAVGGGAGHGRLRPPPRGPGAGGGAGRDRLRHQLVHGRVAGLPPHRGGRPHAVGVRRHRLVPPRPPSAGHPRHRRRRGPAVPGRPRRDVAPPRDRPGRLRRGPGARGEGTPGPGRARAWPPAPSSAASWPGPSWCPSSPTWPTRPSWATGPTTRPASPTSTGARSTAGSSPTGRGARGSTAIPAATRCTRSRSGSRGRGPWCWRWRRSGSCATGASGGPCSPSWRWSG